jgi:hypothetical protein
MTGAQTMRWRDIVAPEPGLAGNIPHEAPRSQERAACLFHQLIRYVKSLEIGKRPFDWGLLSAARHSTIAPA